MTREFVHPTVETVVAIHGEVLEAHGGSSGIRDRMLLESAVAAPQATMMGARLLTDGLEVGAAYLFYLCQNHPFVDGNKRTALATCLVFLSENGLLKDDTLNPDDWEALVLEVASGRIERGELTARMRKLLG